MRNRTLLLIATVLVLGLLAVDGTVDTMARTHCGFIGIGYGNGMMGGQQYRGNTMGGYQQSPTQQGTPVTDITHLTIQNFTFQPMHIQVKASTIVTWTNQDNYPHTMTFKNGMKDSGPLNQGQTFSYTFNTSGTFQYSCDVHPYMVAVVTVIP